MGSEMCIRDRIEHEYNRAYVEVIAQKFDRDEYFEHGGIEDYTGKAEELKYERVGEQ